MDSREEKIIGGDGHVAIHDWEPVDSFGHPKASSEIENDINQTRHTMDVLFDTLTDRLHPRAMVDHFLDRFQLPENRKKVQDVFLNAGKRISDSFQENPIPLLLIGVGVVWLSLERFSAPVERGEKNVSRDKLNEFKGRTTQTVREKFEDAKEKIKNRGEKLRESFSEGKENAAGSIRDAAGRGTQTSENAREEFSQAGEQGSAWQQRISEQYSNTGNTVANLIREKPLAVGFAAAMLGMAAGILFPETKAETRTVGGTAKQTSEWVGEKGADLAERGKRVAEETANTAFNKAEKEGLVSEELSKKTKESVTDKFTHTVEKDKKDTIKSKDVVSPSIEKVEVNLKEKADEKRSQKDLPDKPKI